MSDEVAELKETIEQLKSSMKKSIKMLGYENALTRSMLERAHGEMHSLRSQLKLMEQALHTMQEHQPAQLKKSAAPSWRTTRRTAPWMLTAGAAVATASRMQAAADRMHRAPEPKPPKPKRATQALLIIIAVLLGWCGCVVAGYSLRSSPVFAICMGAASMILLLSLKAPLKRITPKSPTEPSTF